MTPREEKLRPTARELLVKVAGGDHATHSVTLKVARENGTTLITCSCKKKFSVVTRDAKEALRNVPENYLI